MTRDVSRPGTGDPTFEPRVFQLDQTGVGGIAANVNMFRGEVSLALQLVDLPGRNGISLTVTALYSSAVRDAARTWNRAAPTGPLGLGWSMGTDQIVVDDKSTGNPLDGDYYLRAGGVVERLEWCGSGGEQLRFASRQHPLWQIRYDLAASTWWVTRDDGSVAVYGDRTSRRGTVMSGVAWANWIGASRSPSPKLHRYPVAWNLAEVRSPWGDGLTWSYDNDEVEVAGGLTYTRASYPRRIADALGHTVTFHYETKEPFEFVPPHQTPAGEPDPAFQDRYETCALTAMEVRSGRRHLYTVRLGYDLRNVSGHDDDAYTKRFLTSVASEQFGRPDRPPIRLDYETDPASANPGALVSTVYPDGGTSQVEYGLVPIPDVPTNITVPSPILHSRPFVFHGPDYTAIAWYSEHEARTLLQVYGFGGQWSKPWTWEVRGRIPVEQVSADMTRDFFVLYLGGSGLDAVVHLFSKNRYRFGEWTHHELLARRRSPEVAEETVLRAGERFVVLHLGGDWLVHRFWFDPTSDTWLHAEHGRDTTQLALAAGRDFYVVAWYDPGTRTAPYQVFHQDLTGAWRAGPIGSAGQPFDWASVYAHHYWSTGAAFAVGSYQDGERPRLRIVRWNTDFSMSQEEIRDAPGLGAVVSGSMVGAGPLLLRFDGVRWQSYSMAVGIGTPLFTYGDDLGILTLAQGSGSTNTVMAYHPDTGEFGEVPGLSGAPPPTDVEPEPDLDQVWPPSVSGRVVTIAEEIHWQDPDGRLRRIGTLPVSGSKRSLGNGGASFLVYEDISRDPTRTTTHVLLFRDGRLDAGVLLPGERVGTDDSLVTTDQLVGSEAFVTYPAEQSIAWPTKLHLHRVRNGSLSDQFDAPVVSRVHIDNGYESQLIEYSYDAEAATLDPTGRFALFPRVSRVHPDGGRAEYSFHTGLPEPALPAARRPSILAETTDDYSLLVGLIREARVLDAEDFEVSAEHSVWSTLRLEHGVASPLGVGVPSARPVLTRSAVVTGKLALFDLPLEFAAAFDSGTLPAAVRDLFAARGLPLAQDATVTVLAAGRRWEIMSGDQEYPVAVRPGILQVYGSSRRDIVNTYDPATGYLRDQETSHLDSSGARETIRRSTNPAWREYPGMAEARMLTALAGETVTNTTAGVTVSANATTYRADWSDPAPRVWAESASYTWPGGPGLAPPFDHHPDASRQDWVRGECFTARDRRGRPTVVRDVADVATSTLYDTAGRCPVASMVNVDLSTGRQASYLGFEEYEDTQGWRCSDGRPLSDLVTDEFPHTGERCVVLSPDGPELVNEFHLPAGAGPLVLACWTRGGSDGSAVWRVESRAQSGPVATSVLPIPSTDGEWRPVSIRLDPPDPGTATEVVCTAVNTGPVPVFFDDVRLTPVVGGLTAQVYDPETLLTTAALDVNNAVTRYCYDRLSRQVATVGPDGGVRWVGARSYSRRPDDDRFHPDHPNTRLEITPSGHGFAEHFQGPWWDRWDADDREHWSDRAGALVHTSEGAGWLRSRSGDGIGRGVLVDLWVRPGVPARGPVSVTVGRLTAAWHPAGEWRLLDGDRVVARAPGGTLESASWLLIAGPHGVVFAVDGRPLLSHWFTDAVGDDVTLTVTGPDVGFERVLAFDQPRLTLTCSDGAGLVRQRQAMGTDGTRVTGVLTDTMGRPALFTKSMTYEAEPPGYRPRFVTRLDPVSARLDGELSEYYSGGERSDDEGYPYARTRRETAETGRVVESGQPGASLAIRPGAEHTTRVEYGSNTRDGFLDHLPAGQYAEERIVGPDGDLTVTIADQAGRLVGTRQRAEETDIQASYGYDARGALVTVRPPNVHSPPAGQDPERYLITRTVDGLGRLIAEHSSDTGMVEYVYDRRGLLRFSLAAAGRGEDTNRVVYHRYDRLGRRIETGLVDTEWDRDQLDELADTDWPTDAPDWYERQSWDGTGQYGIGRVWRIERNLAPSRPTLRVDVEYGPTGAVTEYREQDEDGEWRVGYSYLGTGELARIDYPHRPGERDQAPVVSYGYDPLGQLVTVGDHRAPDTYARYAYNPDGGLARELLAPDSTNPVDRRYRVNSPGWPVAIDSAAFSERISYWERPGHNGARYYDGRAARLDYSFGPDRQELDYSWLLAYDAQGRLRTAQNTSWPAYGIGTDGEPIDYDSDDNMLRLGDRGATRTLTYEPGRNRVHWVEPGGGYEYDRDGNTSHTPDPLRQELSTDLVSGLTTEVASLDAARLEIHHGVGPRRWRKTWYGPQGVSRAERRYRVGAGDAPLTELVRDGTGEREVVYVHGRGGLVGLVSAGDRATVVKDRLGSSRLLLGDDGDVLGRYEYRPFGDQMGPPGGRQPDLLAYRFTGREWDAETGLYNFLARLYDPTLYRFYSPDPSRSAASPYVYAAGDPVNLVDPDGHGVVALLLIAIGVGATVGGIAGGVTAAVSGSDPSEWQFWAHVGVGVGLGALGGAVGQGVGSAVTAGLSVALPKLGLAAATAATTSGAVLRGVAAGAVGGATRGAVTGAFGKLFGNLIDGKRGSHAWDGVGVAAGWGTLIGTASAGAAGGGIGRTLYLVPKARLRPALFMIARDVTSATAVFVEQLFGTASEDALDNAVSQGDRLSLISHRSTTRSGPARFSEVDSEPNGGPLGGESGQQFGDLRGVQLLPCYPGNGPFAPQFASAARAPIRASNGPRDWRAWTSGLATAGREIWAVPRGARSLTFYPNQLATAWLRLFG